MKKILLATAMALAAFAVAPSTPAAAATADYTAGCTGGGTSLTCTFTAGQNILFISNNAADINLNGTVSGATETFSGGSGATTSSDITFNTPSNVDGIGSFNLTDDLKSGPGGNPTVSLITISITGTGLSLLPNQFGNTFGAHVCDVSSGSACSNTFFATPNSVPTPGPIVGAGFPGIAAGLLWLLARYRRQRGIEA